MLIKTVNSEELDENFPTNLDRDTANWELDDNTSEEFEDNTWSQFNHATVLNEMTLLEDETKRLAYPTKQQYRTFMFQNARNIEFDANEELRRFQAIAGTRELGVNYEKLMDPHIVFAHKAPRSLFSLFHLLINNVPQNER